MRCEQITPYLPGLAGGDLQSRTRAMVVEHLGTCERCRAEAARHDRVGAALVSMQELEVAPPAFLVDALVDGVRRRPRPRLVPLPPLAPAEAVRLLAENRDAIMQAAGAALVAAGAVYAVWRVARRSARPVPATAD